MKLKVKLLVAALLSASAGAQAAWVTTVVGSADVSTNATGISISGQVYGSVSSTDGASSNAFISGPGGLQNLGTLGGAYSFAAGANASGQVVGYATKADGSDNAFLYSNGSMKELALSGYSTWSDFINHIGQAAGNAASLDGNTMPFRQGFLYNRGVITPITMGGGETAVLGLNASGQVVGFGAAPAYPGQYHGYLHSNGVTTDLGTLPGALTSAALSINDAGQVAGYSTVAGDETVTHAFRYSGGVMTDLGTLGGVTSAPVAINSAGLVTGYSDITPGGDYHAFVSDGEHMTDLGTLGGTWSYPTAINGAGQIVGSTALADGKMVPFLYEHGAMVNVADLVTGATDIDSTVFLSESGQIAGNATFDGKMHAFLLTWVPDDASQAGAGSTNGTRSKKIKPVKTQPHGKAVLPAAPKLPGLKCVPPFCVTPGKK